MPQAVRPTIVILALALAACTEAQVEQAEDVVTGGGDDACGAAAFQPYVGQRVDALNSVELPAGARVLFPTTPATMDFNPERLNISVDASDTITRAYCG
jgi:hypothetical protein